VGFHSGKGIVANRIAVPFHNADGELLAYLGLENGKPPVWPDNFDPYREVYNFHRVAAIESDRVVIVSSVPAVWRLHEAGVSEALYLPRDLIFPTRPQFARLLTLSAESALILEPADHQIGLERLLAPFFFTRRIVLDEDVALVEVDELRAVVQS
jgi:virulence-associated protein VagC